MIVLDTNVISELVRPAPDVDVTTWLDDQAIPDLHLTAITVAELGYGIARLPSGRRRDDLAQQTDGLLERLFSRRVLPFDPSAARLYGEVGATRDRLGRPIEIADAQIAAICLHHGAALATRNTRDFDGLGITLINPWEVG